MKNPKMTVVMLPEVKEAIEAIAKCSNSKPATIAGEIINSAMKNFNNQVAPYFFSKVIEKEILDAIDGKGDED